MAAMSIDAVEKVETLPLNPPANASYSFAGGNPIVQFMIASQDKLLAGSTLRLNGTLRVQTPAGVYPNNGRTVGTAANGNRAGAAHCDLQLNARTGAQSCIQQVTVTSLENQTLENVRSYGRYLASVYPVTHSQTDFDSNLQLKSGCQASRARQAGVLVNNDLDFSIPLLNGVFNSAVPIPLGQNGFRGLQIQLELAPDSMVLYGSGSALAPNLTGAKYELRDLSLSYDLLIPDETTRAGMAVPASGAIAYNSVSSLFSVINASDITQSFNFGTSNTLSVIHNFLPSTYQNNYSYDSFQTPRLRNDTGGAGTYAIDAPCREVSFMKAGLKFPIDFEVDVQTQGEEGRPQTALAKPFVDAIKPLPQMNHTLLSTATEFGLGTRVNPATGQKPPVATLAGDSPVFGAGVNFDPVSRVGVNFRNTNYSVRLRSALDGSSPNSVFTYVLAKNVLSYSPNGIAVAT